MPFLPRFPSSVLLANHFQAFKKKFQGFKLKKDAAMHPDLIQGEVEPDLAATNAALWAEYDELK